MKKIDLKAVIEAAELNVEDVAQQLFPSNKYSRLALNRVIAGKALLDADQISKLSMLSGLTVGQLYTGDNWNMSTTKQFLVFTDGRYRAEYDKETGLTKLFDNNSLFHDFVMTKKAIPLSTYLNELELIIKTKFLKHGRN